jgi:hypothetical protein
MALLLLLLGLQPVRLEAAAGLTGCLWTCAA